MNTDLQPMVEDLTANIDTLSTSLAPLLSTALSSTASKLPLLDKAKLYVLATYALESILFSALRLHGQDAKAHPVYAELGRVKAYFAKIATAETAGAGGAEPRQHLDKDAAARFVKHGLAGNERYDRARAEKRESERAGAKRKLEALGVGTHTRFDGVGKRARENEQVVPVVSAADLGEDDAGGGDENDDDDGGDSESVGEKARSSKANGKEVGGLTRGRISGLSKDLSKEESKRLRREAKKERRREKKGEEARANEMK